MNEQWEYWTGFFYAKIDERGVKEHLQQRWPNFQPSKFSPETMIPTLNAMGKEGWELIQMEPVAGVGRNADVLFKGRELANSWSNSYFCVFKRRLKA